MIRKLALAVMCICGLVAGTIPALAQFLNLLTSFFTGRKRWLRMSLSYALFDLMIGGFCGGFLPMTVTNAVAQNPNFSNNAGGEIMVSEYGKWSITTLTPIVVGANTVQFAKCFVKVGTGNRQVFPFWAQGAQALNVPIQVQDGTLSEAVTSETAATFPAAAPPSYPQEQVCSFAATFANAHAAGVTITSGDGGMAEAMNDAMSLGVGQVTIDSTASLPSTYPASTLVYPNIQIVDKRGPQLQYWNPIEALATVLATPTTLTAQAACDATHTFCSDANVAGSASWGSTVYGCVAYLDPMGKEGQCSATANFTSVASKAIDVGAPAASTGAVAYVVYLSLSGGTYALAYRMPLTSANCTLSTLLPTGIKGCAVTNATYGQTGSSAQFTGYPVNTARLAELVTIASSTSVYVPNPDARTSYTYALSNHPSLGGIGAVYQPFTITTAAATTVPNVLGTITVPAGFMNQVGRTIQVCGSATEASAGSTSTITQIQFLWDADGSNTAGAPVIIGGPKVTSTLVTSNADAWDFCQTLMTTVSGAGATAGSMQATDGYISESYGAGVSGVGNTGPTAVAAAVGSLNLAGEGRIDVVYLHTTGTDGAGVILQNLRVSVIN